MDPKIPRERSLFETLSLFHKRKILRIGKEKKKKKNSTKEPGWQRNSHLKVRFNRLKVALDERLNEEERKKEKKNGDRERERRNMSDTMGRKEREDGGGSSGEGKTVTTLNSQEGHLLARRRLPSRSALVNVATIVPIVEDKGGAVEGWVRMEVKGARSMQ